MTSTNLHEIPAPHSVLSANTDGLGTLVINRVGGDRQLIGSKYNECAHLTRAQIAALIRKDLKQGWATDHGIFDPQEFTIRVRTKNYAGGGSITIEIVDFTPSRAPMPYREEANVEAMVRQIARRYHKQTDNMMTDYCWNNFFLFVELSEEVQRFLYSLDPAPKDPTPEDYESAARGKYSNVPGLVVSDTEPDDCKANGEYVMAYVWVTDAEAQEAMETDGD